MTKKLKNGFFEIFGDFCSKMKKKNEKFAKLKSLDLSEILKNFYDFLC